MSALLLTPHDHVTEWLDELLRAASTAAALSPAARAAVVELIDSFAAEDGVLPRAALEVRLVFAATAVEPYAIAVAPALEREALLPA